jgi:hypothetical protein
MKRPVVLIALLLAAPASAEQSEITLQLQKANPERARPAKQVPFPDIRDWKTLKITLKRGACFGVCPVYKVEINGDGSVAYEGKNFVAIKGDRNDQIAVQTVRDLYAQFKNANFFWLFDTYRAQITDGPTYLISISFDGHSKEILDYEGTMVGMPREVPDLEEKIDAAAGPKKWVKGSEDQPGRR